jgi:hypothetical protein
MKNLPRTRRNASFLAFTVILLAFTSLAFTQPFKRPINLDANINGVGALPNPTLMPEAMVNFKVTIPNNTPPGEGINLYILDEVTGLALNPQKMTMRASDPTHYMLSIPFPIGSLVYYRYGRQSTTPAYELTSDGKPIHYRLYRVDGPNLVQDSVARWTDTPFNGKTGRIEGIISDSASGKPIPNLMIVCGGRVTQSGRDGVYRMAGLPIGFQTLLAFARDGSYRSFQQGALVAENSITPASFKMAKAKTVNVVFSVTIPIDTPAEATLRMAGNLSQLGDTFSDPSLNGEVDVKRMPKMVAMGNQRYALALQLPAGTDLRYKYSLGDSFWNAERSNDGTLRVRQVIVPETSRVIEEQVISWSDGSKEPLGFEYHPPEGSASGAMAIQFYSHGWTRPIPLWNSPNNRLTYILYGPLNLVGQGFKYRFCAQEKCDTK